MGAGNSTVKANTAGVSVSPTPVAIGSSLTATYLGALSTSSRVGLALVGSSDATTLLQSNVPNAGNGTVGFTISGSFSAGSNYEARLYKDATSTVIARSAAFTVTTASTYTLTVTNGTGSASGLVSGAVRAIAPGPPPAGQAFHNWTIVSGPGSFANANSATTNFTMGAGNATVQANFAGPSVGVAPNPLTAGTVLTATYTGATNTSHWIGLYGVGYTNSNPFMVANVPTAGSGTVTFTLNNYFTSSGSYEARLFKDLAYTLGATSPTFAVTCTLTVNSGTGNASGLANGAVRTITALAPPQGQTFKNWTVVSGAGTFASSTQSQTNFTIGNLNAVVQANYAENVPPTTPGPLSAGSITQSSVTLTWGAASDNVGVTGYQVFRNGTLLTTAAGLTFTNSGLSPATSYAYYVKAIDAAGNTSAAGNTVNVTTLNTTQADSSNQNQLIIHLPL